MESSTTVQPTAAAPEATAHQRPRYLFEPFSWHSVPVTATAKLPAHVMADFASEVQDVARGVRTVMQMIEQDRLEAENADDHGDENSPRLLSIGHTANITRLCIVTLDLLAKSSEEAIEWAEERSRQNGCA
jgi:hypothetical protein